MQRRRRRPALVLGLTALTIVLAGSACDRRDGTGRDTSAGPERSSGPSTTAEAGGESPAPDVATTFGLPAPPSPEPPVPDGSLTLSLAGATTGGLEGRPQIECLVGDGFFDVSIAADPPLPVDGGWAVSAVQFGAPGYRGPGRYDAAKARDAEWSLELVDVETGEVVEYYSPLQGPSGAITIDEGARSGSIVVRGLVDDGSEQLGMEGSFTCGTVTRM